MRRIRFSALLLVLLLSLTCCEDKKKEDTRVIVDAYATDASYICGVDQFGRSFMPVTGFDDAKDVGMFYFLWHGESGTTTYNISELLENSPEDLWDKKGTAKSPLNNFHYWDEPLFGYYKSCDKWVIRKHAQMLTLAGVDFLVFDTTNAVLYNRSAIALMEVFDELQNDGWDVPKIAFYTNTYSIKTMNALYDSIYKKDLYPNLWYCPDGTHPLIIGALTPAIDKDIVGDKSYNPDVLSDEFRDFFDLRSTQWPYNPVNEDAFPWMEWSYPQPSHNGIMSVSLVQHPQLPCSASYFDRTRNRGRGYDVVNDVNVAEDMRMGTNAQSQWDTVLSTEGIHTVFVTGWNEWIAIKSLFEGEIGFIDTFDEEFSRDIEPPRSGRYEDAFYVQLCDNIRRFKGYRDRFQAPDKATIDVSQGATQWDGIRNVYKDFTKRNEDRNQRSVDNKVKYIQAAPQDNILEVKVTDDKDNIYMLITTENDISLENRKANWMDIFIGTGEVRKQGWESYSYLVAMDPSSKETFVYSLDENGNKTQKGEAQISVQGNFLQLSVSKKSLGIKSENGFYFKVATDVEDPTNIMSYYTSGESMPMGRLSYYYYF